MWRRGREVRREEEMILPEFSNAHLYVRVCESFDLREALCPH